MPSTLLKRSPLRSSRGLTTMSSTSSTSANSKPRTSSQEVGAHSQERLRWQFPKVQGHGSCAAFKIAKKILSKQTALHLHDQGFAFCARMQHPMAGWSIQHIELKIAFLEGET